MSAFLPDACGYRNLRAFKSAQHILDLTVVFINRFVPHMSRTRDQMEQAARSGVQNIGEGSAASVTSKETEIKLTNVAKASLEELLLDYEDYLRHNSLQLWDKNNPRTLRLRRYLSSPAFDANPLRYAKQYTAEEFCNLCISLIHQTTYLLRRLLIAQQEQFLQTGGIRELMYRARKEYREAHQGYTTSPRWHTPRPTTPPPTQSQQSQAATPLPTQSQQGETPTQRQQGQAPTHSQTSQTRPTSPTCPTGSQTPPEQE